MAHASTPRWSKTRLLDPMNRRPEGNVDDTLQVTAPALRQVMSAVNTAWTRQADAVGERPSPEPGEANRVDSADADNGQHQDDGLEDVGI